MDIEERQSKAKALFVEYACNTFFMSREGRYDAYREFGVSKEQERQWRAEYIQEWVARLGDNDLRPIEQLANTWAWEALPDLLVASTGSYGIRRLWFANAIWDLAERGSVPAGLQHRGLAQAVALWESLVAAGEGQIAETDQVPADALIALRAKNPGEYVVNYARQKLADISQSRIKYGV